MFPLFSKLLDEQIRETRSDIKHFHRIPAATVGGIQRGTQRAIPKKNRWKNLDNVQEETSKDTPRNEKICREIDKFPKDPKFFLPQIST